MRRYDRRYRRPIGRLCVRRCGDGGPVVSVVALGIDNTMSRKGNASPKYHDMDVECALAGALRVGWGCIKELVWAGRYAQRDRGNRGNWGCGGGRRRGWAGEGGPFAEGAWFRARRIYVSAPRPIGCAVMRFGYCCHPRGCHPSRRKLEDAANTARARQRLKCI